VLNRTAVALETESQNSKNRGNQFLALHLPRFPSPAAPRAKYSLLFFRVEVVDSGESRKECKAKGRASKELFAA
jgi:hypothetical protein